MEPKGSFQLKGKLFTLTVLQLFNDDLNCLEQELKQHVEMAPAFFNHTPVVIDLNEMENLDEQFDFNRLKQIIHSCSLIPVGVKGAQQHLKPKIEETGLAILAENANNGDDKKSHHSGDEKKAHANDNEPKNQSGEKTQDSTSNSASSTQESSPQQTPQPSRDDATVKANGTQARVASNAITEVQTIEVAQQSKLLKQTIRSGQQVYARNGDLIIIGSVSAGAEVLADGNIHIYGTLRGRALAGVKGNTKAAIFCHNLQAELVSIAGIYKLSDDMPNDHIGGFSQISLIDENLHFHHLN